LILVSGMRHAQGQAPTRTTPHRRKMH